MGCGVLRVDDNVEWVIVFSKDYKGKSISNYL